VDLSGDVVLDSQSPKLACKVILHCLRLCMGSLALSSIGEAGARELFTALQFNKTLSTLE
jgi:hypothetical protein